MTGEAPTTQDAAPSAVGATERGKRVGVIHHRGRLGQRLNAWRKRSPLNPYWLDWRALRRSVEKLVPEASGMLLDVGASENPYRQIFTPRVDHYMGLEYPAGILDKQPEMWEILPRLRPMVQIFGDGAHLPILTESIDTVLSTEVLEHTPDPAALVNEMGRVLKPGGKLLLTVPFIQPLHELPNDYYRFTPTSLAAYVKAAGLKLESMEPRGNFASATGSMLSQWIARTFCAKVLQSDGSVVLSPIRSLLCLPLTVPIQLFFHLASKLTNDHTVCQGYAIVATKPPTELAAKPAAAG